MIAAFLVGVVAGGILAALGHQAVSQSVEEQRRDEMVWVHWYDPRHPEHEMYAHERHQPDPPPLPCPALVRRGPQAEGNQALGDRQSSRE